MLVHHHVQLDLILDNNPFFLKEKISFSNQIIKQTSIDFGIDK
jgi:hypothetical protein